LRAFFSFCNVFFTKLRSRIIGMTISTSPLFRILPALLGALCAPACVHAEDAPPKCTYVEVASLPIRYVGESLEPAVDGTINGTPATMLIDTGSDQTHMTMNAATRRDLNVFMTGRYVQGIGGLSRLYSARLKDFSTVRRTPDTVPNSP